MGLFDRLRGKAKSEDDAAAGVSSAEAAAAVSPSLDLTEQPAAPGPSARQQAFSKQFGVAASEELYNPYEGELGRGAQLGGSRRPLRIKPYACGRQGRRQGPGAPQGAPTMAGRPPAATAAAACRLPPAGQPCVLCADPSSAP